MTPVPTVRTLTPSAVCYDGTDMTWGDVLVEGKGLAHAGEAR